MIGSVYASPPRLHVLVEELVLVAIILHPFENHSLDGRMVRARKVRHGVSVFLVCTGLDQSL